MLSTMLAKKKGRPPKGDVTIQFSLRMSPALRAATDAAAKASRRAVNTEIVIALERYLAQLGLWPPAMPPNVSNDSTVPKTVF